MSFWGTDFIFDNEYSENYGLKIYKINDNSIISEASGGCGMEIFADAVYRNPTLFHQGVAQNEPLEFDIEFGSEDELPAVLRSKIEKWLFGRMKYCKLQILQRDLQDIFFSCHLINPTLTYIGNVCHGIKCTVHCDAPWAWQYEKTYRIDGLPEKGMTDAIPFTWRHYNDSDDTDYTYPVITFKMTDSFYGNGDCSIINTNDNDREFLFRGMTPGEVVTVDCRNQLITSSTNLLISNKFNKHFLRLVPGVNYLKLTGEFEYLTLTYKNARKVGG